MLFRTYWKPLYGWLRNTGQTAQDPEDLIQQLFYEILSNDSLNSIEKEGGKFRSFLITTLKNRTIDGYRRQRAAKRGGGILLPTLDVEQGESFIHATDPFWRAWLLPNIAFSLLVGSTENQRGDWK